MKLFNFIKNRKEKELKIDSTNNHSFIDKSEVNETIDFNIDQLKRYFEKRRNNSFDEKDSYFVEMLEARTKHYNECGFYDDFTEVIKNNKKMFGYWQSIIPINTLLKDALLYYFLTVKDFIELPDLEEVVGSSFVSDFDLYIRLLDSLIEKYHHANKSTNYGACSIENYTLTVRKEVPNLVNKEFALDEFARKQCNAFCTNSIYDYITFSFNYVSENKDRWEVFVGKIAEEKISK